MYAGDGIDVAALNELADSVLSDPYILKDARWIRERRIRLPLFDCFKAPCAEAPAPSNSRYPNTCNASCGDYDRAFDHCDRQRSARGDGEICSHVCQTKCMRIDYDEPLQIRQAKRLASQNAQKYIDSLKPVPLRTDKRSR